MGAEKVEVILLEVEEAAFVLLCVILEGGVGADGRTKLDSIDLDLIDL